jgi:hypothetical protein
MRKMPWVWTSFDLCMDHWNIHYVGNSVISKLEVDESLETWLELIRGCNGSMWADMFMAYVIQVKYMWMFVRNLQCCACVGGQALVNMGVLSIGFCF